MLIWGATGAGYFWPIWVIGPLAVAGAPVLLLLGRSGGRAVSQGGGS